MFGRAFATAAAAAVLNFAPFGPAAAGLSSEPASPTLDDVEISPDGQKLASIATTGDQRLLTIRTVAGDPFIAIDITGRNVRDIAWAGDGHVLIKTTRTTNLPFLADKADWPMVQSFNLQTRTFATLLGVSTGSTHGRTVHADAVLLNVAARGPYVRTVDGKPRVFIYGYSQNYDLELYEVDLDTGKGVHRKDAGQVMDAKGDALARSEWFPRDGRWRLMARGEKGWREALALTGLAAVPDLYGAGRSPETVLVAIPENARTALYEISLKDGSKSPAGFDDHSAGTAHPIYDTATGRLMGFRSPEAGGVRYSFVDPAQDAVWASIRTAFEGKDLELVSWTPDFRQIVVRIDGPEGGGFFLVDTATHKATRLGPATRSVSGRAVAPAT